jgi:F-box-like
VISITILPDEILLSIFDFCVDEDLSTKGINRKKVTDAWQPLVHVCRQWRRIVFGSPRRLNLRLFCTGNTRARDMLDVWPALPLVVYGFGYYNGTAERIDNIFAALKRSNRIHEIELVEIYTPDFERVLATMQDPFPELTKLRLWADGEIDETKAVIPDSFLGGSAQRLQHLWLKYISFPGLPKLLLSATHITELLLQCIPHSGYISPEVIVTALSTLTSLKLFFLGFQSLRSRPDRESRRPPLPTRTVLPALTDLIFHGASEYLEVFMARIDTPRLYSLYITFTDQNIFDTPQFGEFISRTPMSKGFEKAWVAFDDVESRVNLSSQTSGYRVLDVKITCSNFDLQFSSLKQFCSSSLPSLSILEDLYMTHTKYRSSIDSHSDSQENFDDWLYHLENTVTIYKIENSRWLELLHPFSTAKNLYLSELIVFSSIIEPALKELVGSRTTEVLPTLQNIFLEWPWKVPEGIEQFVAARQATGHPIAVSRWNRNSK